MDNKSLKKLEADLWTSGKAMFVCLNKVTCVRMFDLVQKYWKEETEHVAKAATRATQQEAQELARKLEWMRQTEMTVVISQEQNEIQTFEKWGLNIRPHREKMEKRELDKEFKDAANPFRVVFVCAMWLTGFDVKSLSCLYLDKPLRAHTLMQTIARANRVAEGKSNGLIVDYVGIVKALRKALADYTANTRGGDDPTIDKEELITRILDVMDLAERFLAERDFVLAELVQARDFRKLELLKDAANKLCVDLETKKAFQTYAAELVRLMKYVDRDDISDFDRARKDALGAIYGELQKKRKKADNEALKKQIHDIIKEYVEVKEADDSPEKLFNLAKINFSLLQREFARAKRENLILKDLEELVRQRLDSMLLTNPARIDYYDRYRKIIEAYNSEQDRASIEKTFMDLMDLAESMDEETSRYVREGFESDEELSLYDLLFSENLSKKDIEEIKQVAKELLSKIKAKIAEMDHWADKQVTRDAVKILIRNVLWGGLPESYSDESLENCREKVFEYVYMRYKAA